MPFKMWMEAEHYSHFYTRKKMDDDLIHESAKKKKKKERKLLRSFHVDCVGRCGNLCSVFIVLRQV